VKPKVIKAVCKDNVLLTTPFAASVGIILTVGTDSKRYCAEFGGQEKKNDAKLTKRKNAPPPAQCPAPQVPATATASATATGTAAATITATATPAGTAAATATATVPLGATPTATGAGTAAATATVTPIPPNPTPTATPGVACPLNAGSYTVTQGSGGTLDVYNFAPFPFPSGGMIVQDVGAGDANCVHSTVVPFPGGFNASFVSAAVTTSDADGVRHRSNRPTVGRTSTTEIGDTSSPTVCGLPQSPCTNGANKGVQVNITVGDGSPDTCASGGTANALVSVPVHTVSWSDTSGGTFNGCPGNGVFDGSDMIAAEFDQILDFTTDTATGSWSDLDPDGCSIAGFGPAAGYTRTGVCIDIGLGTVTPVAVGEFGATGGLFDGTFATKLPSTFSGPGAPLGATCASPPVINYNGLATRCIP
jgi:hypothetical protein